MLLSEDLRGREFRWSLGGASGREIVVGEEGTEAVRLIPAIESSPAYFATLGGERLRIEHSASAVGPIFRASDPDRERVVAASHYEPDLRLFALFDASRPYSLRRTPDSAAWQDAGGDVVSFRPKGSAYVLMGADPVDAPALLLLGIVMAVEHTLFTAVK